ncbi:MAG: BTAD domain-containing putative transcriptional regulator, partial [Ilumatobacteraceae bacterium]
MRFRVLGPLEVVDEQGRPIDVGGRQPRLVLAALIAAGGRPVGADSLVELLWPDRPPASAAGTVQSYVSRLRRLLGSIDGTQLVFEHGAYRLELPPDLVDIQRFETLATAGREELAAGRPRVAREHLVEALEMWRGPALVDLTDRGVAIHHATSLEERRLAALEARLDADLALGRHELIVGELRVLAADHPLREGVHARLALALYRSGRQAEALRTLADAAIMLRDELGLDPGKGLADLELAILEHDQALDAPTFASPNLRESAGGVFVGREAESGVLVAAYEAAVGDAQFVVVEGDPGIGKTRLVEEAATLFAAEGSCVVWARSNDIDATGALRPWLDAVRVLSSQTDELPRVLDELLSDHVPPSADLSAGGQFERFRAIALLLERFGGPTPMVIVLDDLQWFDPASLDLLRFLASQLTNGVLVIATLRTLEIGRADALTDTLGALARRPGNRRLRLSGLSRSATAELVGAVSTGPTDTRRADHIHERAEGNPFYTLELARLLDEPGSNGTEVPATVADAVGRRLQQLDPATLDVLTVAAVVGREVNVPLVARVTELDLDRCAERLDEAAAHRMLVSAPESASKLRFAHALVREVLLDGLTPLRRSRLHLRVADALDATGSGDVETVADHLWRAAALGVGDRAASALERAAELAVGRVAYSTAEDLLHRAVVLRRDSPGATSSVGRQALLDAQLRLIAVMRTTRYFSGTDRALLRSAQALSLELGHDEISRELAWSEWASVSRAADVAGARSIADGYRQRWASSPSASVRASVLIVDGVTDWSEGEMTAAIARLDEAARLNADAEDGRTRVHQELPLIGDVFGLYCHAAAGDTTPENALSRF